jgi:hypothetical protein
MRFIHIIMNDVQSIEEVLMGRATRKRWIEGAVSGRPSPAHQPVVRTERAGVGLHPREGVAAADPSDPRRDVLAVVLTDGSIQLVADPAAKEKEQPRWKNGRLRGPGWVMWWELRSWEDDGRG